ncbi:MAG: PilZ domain-containing protein [Candidatus Eremiobacteraeota bacterium]|nr:PilZ domain-containing protein [Candidatus Eremiobacteraeota bacterium]
MKNRRDCFAGEDQVMFGSAAPKANDSAGKNDRKFYRLAVNFPIEVTCPSVAVPVAATLGDISEGGCRIISRSMLLRGGAVQFSLTRENKAPLQLQGVIASVDFRQPSRLFHYGVQFKSLRPSDTDSIYQFIVEQQRRGMQNRGDEAACGQKAVSNGAPLRSVRERAAYRAERTFPVRYTTVGVRGSVDAFAVDVSVGGMRIAFDRKMQLDRELDIRFTLPNDVLGILTKRETSRSASIFGHEMQTKEVKAREFSEIQVHAKLLPAMEQVKGRYLYSVVFVRATAFVSEELQRFVHATQLQELKKQRSGGGSRII